MKLFGDIFNEEYANLSTKVYNRILELVKNHNLSDVTFGLLNYGSFNIGLSEIDEVIITLKSNGGTYIMTYVLNLHEMIILHNQIENYVESNIDEQ